MRCSVGIDVGGTYTDLVAIEADGTARAIKVLSTPSDQSEGVVGALAELREPPENVERIVHGTTVATNALLERAGAHVVLCATQGATDLLELRRQERASLYDLSAQHPTPLIPAASVVAVPERVAPEGVVRQLSAAAAEEVADAVAAAHPEVVAIALLHSYAEPAHERLLARALSERLPQMEIVLSSDVLPEIREYERTATTAAEAYLRPTVARYLRHLASSVRRSGYPAPGVMTSSGGMRGAEEAAGSAASLALSGPAGGVVGAAVVARAAGMERALTIDIGGTSADVGLILAGTPLVEPGGEVAGAPIALPRVLVETISAGGGSIAWRDEGGALRVGPRSAGAVPGPAAFRRGGTEPTVTDAHVLLGHLPAGDLSGGVRVDAGAAARAVRTLSDALGATPERTARAILATADAAMARALRRVSVERGVDPRGCGLVAFGGAGPLHACGLAELLGVRTVLVPPFAGVLSALGLAMTAERRESMCSVLSLAADLDESVLRAMCAELVNRAGSGARREWWLRARYVGQGHELEVPVEPGIDGRAVAARFGVLHEARFGFRLARQVELVSMRHASSSEAREVTLARRGRGTWDAHLARDDGSAMDVSVRGPASIALPDATLLVSEGWSARTLPIGGWMLERA